MSGDINTPLFCDLEATGLHPDSHPIQIAYSLPNGEIESWLVRPDASWPEHWDYNAQDLHGIPKKMLYEAGRPCFEIARRMNEVLAGRTIFSDCVAWDKFWLLMIFESADLRPAFDIRDISTILPAAIVSNPIRWNNVLEDAWHRVGGRRHRADDDVAALREFYRLAASYGCGSR